MEQAACGSRRRGHRPLVVNEARSRSRERVLLHTSTLPPVFQQAGPFVRHPKHERPGSRVTGPCAVRASSRLPPCSGPSRSRKSFPETGRARRVQTTPRCHAVCLALPRIMRRSRLRRAHTDVGSQQPVAVARAAVPGMLAWRAERQADAGGNAGRRGNTNLRAAVVGMQARRRHRQADAGAVADAAAAIGAERVAEFAIARALISPASSRGGAAAVEAGLTGLAAASSAADLIRAAGRVAQRRVRADAGGRLATVGGAGVAVVAVLRRAGLAHASLARI